MSLALKVPVPKLSWFGAFSPTLFIGSCFATEIGNRFEKSMMPTEVNPYGTLFNPVSILENLTDAMLENNPEKDGQEFYHDGELWHSWRSHGQLSNPELEKVRQNFVAANHRVKSIIESEGSTLLLTFGSAFVHELEGTVVANCHKAPSQIFSSRFLEVEEILLAFENLMQKLPTTVRVAITVSPVRYSKIGLNNNSISKGILHSAVNKIKEKYPGVAYFPAYEIVLDELRDYRFYTDDLVHPNETAINIVWDRFVEAFGDEAFIERMVLWNQIYLAQNHKIRFPETKSAKQFSEHRQQLLENYLSTYKK